MKKITAYIKKLRNTPLFGYYRYDGTQDDSINIPLVDVRDSSPAALAVSHRGMARRFLAKMSQAFGLIPNVVLPLAKPLMDKISHNWLKKTKNPYLAEIEQTAKAIGKAGIYTMSVSYEWGCTTGAYQVGDTHMALARVMDWPFPLLGDNLVVAHQKGAAGDFYNVTWPGYNGVVQAMAPGRFAAAVNQAPGSKPTKNGFKNWLRARRKINNVAEGVLPPTHALRQAFETAASYAEAKKMLIEVPLTSPVIFTLSGTKAGEGCVIERTADKAYVRELLDGRVTVANMFESELKDTNDNWACRRGDSHLRSAYARTITAEEVTTKGSFPWFTSKGADESTLRSYFSRVVMTADAATGTLQVMGTGGEKPVTKVFRLG